MIQQILRRCQANTYDLLKKANKNPTIESSDLVAFKDHFQTKFSVLEAKITNDAKLVKIQTKSLTQYIKAVAKDNELKNHKLEQTLKQKPKKEGNVSFRNKGNKLQYEFNVEQVVNWKKQNAYLTIKIDKVINEMQNCSKLIQLVDRSAGGLMTVQEYMPDELASDSKKIRQVGNRATKKRKFAFARKPASTF